MNLHIHRLAVVEIDHEVDYYESREQGLGAVLEDIVETDPIVGSWCSIAFHSRCLTRSKAMTSSSSRSRTRADDRATGRDASR